MTPIRTESRAYHCAVLCALLFSCSDETSVAEPSADALPLTPFTVKRIDKVDVLFVIDNSQSMAGEQAALSAQFPRLIQRLTRGERYPDDPAPFTPITDLHIGVVSTDMGIPGVEFGSCSPIGGDDGRLQRTPKPGPGRTCETGYPPFLSYTEGVTDPAKLAEDFACVATLGTSGCGFEAQLEAPLKALWPTTYRDADGNVAAPNPINFLAVTAAGTHGKGDVPQVQGGNLGFLRDDSLLMIVLVTDEDDCSVIMTEHLKPKSLLPPGSSYAAEDTNLRCFYHPDFNYDVITRYYQGFRKLRPGHEERVVFTAITGVPVDLVDPQALAGVDFGNPSARDAFYERLLDDPRMQQTVDPASNPGSGRGTLTPACSRSVPGEQAPSTAFPARRIATLAKAFGSNGMIQSICQDDFGPAIDSFVGVMAKPLGEMCMAEQLPRNEAGTVNCKMFWQLGATGTDAPAHCSELGDLLAADAEPAGEATSNERCEIRQLAVHGAAAQAGEGWYYDDFTAVIEHMCATGLSRRIAFSAGARPPKGVAVSVECNGKH
jgi:hypothetical protein